MSGTIEDFKKLRTRLTETNNRVAQLKGQREAQQEQLSKILSSHGCQTIEELKDKFIAAEANLTAATAEAEKYLTEVGAQISKLDAATAKAEDIDLV